MKKIRQFNKKYLSLIYQFGDKIKKPLWMILSLWIPLTTIILLLNFNLVSVDTLVKGLIILSFPIVYSTVLLSTELKGKKKRYKELKQLGVKVFGCEDKYKRWMHSNVIALGGKKPIDVDPDEARKELFRIEHGMFS